TVDTLITHTPWWTVQAMGFQGLWVAGDGKEISTHKSHGKFEEILFASLIGLLNWKAKNQCHLLLKHFPSAVLVSYLSQD
ncbi:hypothetical protein K443DRAFT_93313, partial [Laccaria amethystina LaAM-08-1]